MGAINNKLRIWEKYIESFINFYLFRKITPHITKVLEINLYSNENKMHKCRFREVPIVGILKTGETGRLIKDVFQ